MSYNILIVDDEEEIADLIETYLKNEDYTVFKFYSAKMYNSFFTDFFFFIKIHTSSFSPVR